MNDYDPKRPPPEPAPGTVVKDRHGGLSMRYTINHEFPRGVIGETEGWGDPWKGTLPFGVWAAMWEARGPLEVVPHPRDVKEERVAEPLPKIFAVVDGPEGAEFVIAAFTDEAVANKFAEHPATTKSYGSVRVKPLVVLSDGPTETILYKKRSGGTVVAEKFWDFEGEERISQGWFRTVEEAFEASA